MTEQQTCGKGLAARSSLPAALAEVTDAMASILAFHQRSLEQGAAERQAYARLEEQYRAVASLLKTTAQTMAAARDLPMANHDITVLASPENAAVFARFVELERDLVSLLESSITKDRAILDQMRDSGRR
jgi:hypothetical protein